MIAPDDPPGFVVRTEAQKCAFDNGFRIEAGVQGGWLRYRSTTARGDIWLAGVAPKGPWYLSVSHPGVATEIGQQSAHPAGPGIAAWVFPNLAALYAATSRAYQLGFSLPDAPLDVFRAKTAAMPTTTEAERLVVQRVGQNIFRASLLEYWGGRCPLTGVTDPALLRASHIVAWAECDDDAQRLDVHNGLLLSALWDAAFDGYRVSFADDGVPLFSALFGATEKALLQAGAAPKLIGLTEKHAPNLSKHRRRAGVG